MFIIPAKILQAWHWRLHPVGKGKRELEDMVSKKADDVGVKKGDDANANKADDADGVKPKGGAEADGPVKGKDGEAYEDGSAPSEKTAILVASRKQLAIEFYQKHNPGMDIADIKSHINGIDFTKPIEIIKIPEGGELIQFTKVNSRGEVLRGDYYTDNPNSTPSQLGVSDKYNVRDPDNGWQYTEEVKSVSKETVTIPKESEGLKSTSAEIQDIWSLKNKSVYAEGGGSQIYVPKSQFK